MGEEGKTKEIALTQKTIEKRERMRKCGTRTREIEIETENRRRARGNKNKTTTAHRDIKSKKIRANRTCSKAARLFLME